MNGSSSTANPYEVLNATYGDGEDVLRLAYKTAMMRHHPDKGGSSEAFREVQASWKLIQGGWTPPAPTAEPKTTAPPKATVPPSAPADQGQEPLATSTDAPAEAVPSDSQAKTLLRRQIWGPEVRERNLTLAVWYSVSLALLSALEVAVLPTSVPLVPAGLYELCRQIETSMWMPALVGAAAWGVRCAHRMRPERSYLQRPSDAAQGVAIAAAAVCTLGWAVVVLVWALLLGAVGGLAFAAWKVWVRSH